MNIDFKAVLLVIALALSNSVYAAPEIKGNPEDLRSYFHPKEKTLTIRDSAEETAYSDRAIVNIVVKTTDKLLSNALKMNSELRMGLADTLVNQGIDAENIKNSKFSSSPQYGWFGDEPKSYEVINRVAIKIDSEKQLQSIAKVADDNLQINIVGTTFEHSKKDEFEKRVKEKAVNKILDKKAYYEKTLGVKLTVISFSESDVGFNATEGADLLVEEVVVLASRSSKASYSKRRAPQPSSFDEVKYRANVAVEYKVN